MTIETRPSTVKRDTGKRLAVFGILGLIIAIADQWSKHLVTASIPLGSGFALVPGFINLVHARNTGAAFGIMSDPDLGSRSTFLLIISLVALVAIIGMVFYQKKTDHCLIIGYSLFFGGALGNLLDRVRLGEVVDFIDVCVRNYHWPAFNFADSALSIGVVFFLLHAFRGTTDG